MARYMESEIERRGEGEQKMGMDIGPFEQVKCP